MKLQQLRKLMAFVNYNIKQGIFDEDEWGELGVEEFIKRAEYEMERADHYACHLQD